ncbi:MAG: caspase family protein [Acidobacteria bacterium]|nr:caspase family protein [Acidobacteriota bacterium]MBV9474992.1 caspase family protein [Acidobacteriota bacterium]
MKKKAVLVAVGDYRGFAPSLDAPVTELGEWAALLRNYGFTVTSLADQNATRTKVLAAFQQLVTGAQPNDQLVFGFFGHGSTVPAPVDEGRFKFEEALMVFPQAQDAELTSSAITDSDLSRVLAIAAPPIGTDLTLIIDTCFSGAFQPAAAKRGRAHGKAPDMQPLFIPPKELPRSGDVVREFGSYADDAGTETASAARGGRTLNVAATPVQRERPLVVAACGRSETALELRLGAGKSRLLFSKRATEFLKAHADATFNQLIAGIKPLKEGVRQSPELRVNVARGVEPFPGKPGQAAPSPFSSISRVDDPVETPVTPKGAEGIMNSIDIRFRGMCCFLDSRRRSDPYQKRVVLPFDDRKDPEVRHKAYIEVAEDEIDGYGIDPTISTPHNKGGQLQYLRWELDGVRIDFENADSSADALSVTSSFAERVPGMKFGVCEELPYHPSDDCFEEVPDPARIAAFADLRCGTLTAGPLEDAQTQFISTSTAGTFDGRTPKWVVLHLPLTEPAARIRVGGGPDDWISVKPGGSVLIGNEREIDILGIPNSDDPARTFYLYYQLGDQIPVDPPIPAGKLVPLNGCSVSNWP